MEKEEPKPKFLSDDNSPLGSSRSVLQAPRSRLSCQTCEGVPLYRRLPEQLKELPVCFRLKINLGS